MLVVVVSSIQAGTVLWLHLRHQHMANRWDRPSLITIVAASACFNRSIDRAAITNRCIAVDAVAVNTLTEYIGLELIECIAISSGFSAKF
jgi:hypothetical protein